MARVSVLIRMTEEEKRAIEAAAELVKMPVSRWIHATLLDGLAEADAAKEQEGVMAEAKTIGRMAVQMDERVRRVAEAKGVTPQPDKGPLAAHGPQCQCMVCNHARAMREPVGQRVVPWCEVHKRVLPCRRCQP